MMNDEDIRISSDPIINALAALQDLRVEFERFAERLIEGLPDLIETALEEAQHEQRPPLSFCEFQAMVRRSMSAN
jgi:hypothetical protein